MQTKLMLKLVCLCLLPSVRCLPAFAQGPAFTCQGQLNDGVNMANGSDDLTFSLWHASSGPAQVVGPFTNANTAISNGLFTVALDFGANFPGAKRWLEIIARTTTNTVAVSWPPPSTGFTLEQNTNNVSSVNWSNVVTTSSDNGTTRMVIVNPPLGNRHYRLFKA